MGTRLEKARTIGSLTVLAIEAAATGKLLLDTHHAKVDKRKQDTYSTEA